MSGYVIVAVIIAYLAGCATIWLYKSQIDKSGK